jgi:hypothetical protein
MCFVWILNGKTTISLHNIWFSNRD